MKKFLEYFYILSKLSTSFVLIIALVFTGYLFYNSYNSINLGTEKQDENISRIFKIIENNQNNIKQIANDLETKLLIIEDLKLNLESEKNNINFKNDQIDILSKQISALSNEIINIEKKLNIIHNQSNQNLSKKFQIQDIKNIIFVKLLNNRNIENEIDLLYDLVSENNVHYIDKIKILNKKIYFDFNQINAELQLISEKYLKKNIINKQNNYLINFLSPIITIKPSNSISYNDDDLRLLKSAQDFLVNKKFADCIKNLQNLKVQNKNLENFISKIQIYKNLEITIDKIE
tara:strand:+ start:844 stop:1713 length:870 start_codon:yes stop_codon:yes gene_type:complete